ncbi:MAG: IS3 family transposase [Nitrospirota bacterium]
MAVARSGFSAWCQRPVSRQAQQNQFLLAQIRKYHRDSNGSDGSPRIHRDLWTQGLRSSRHRVARLMRLHGIRGVCRRRVSSRGRTASPAVVAANVLQRDFAATQPNQKWAGDIT